MLFKNLKVLFKVANSVNIFYTSVHIFIFDIFDCNLKDFKALLPPGSAPQSIKV